MKVDLIQLRERPLPRQPSGRKKRYLAGCLCAVLACAAAIGGVLAYQTKAETDDNIFLVGEVQIESYEPHFPTEDDPVKGRVDGVPDVCELLTPFDTVPKDPYIKNTGKNECVVFFRVTTPVEILNLINDDGSRQKNVAEDLFWMKLAGDSDDTHANHFGDGWVMLEAETGHIVKADGLNHENRGKTYVFGYHEVLKPGKFTPTLFDKVQNKRYGSRTIDADEVENIRVEAFAIQSEYIKREGIDTPTSGSMSEDTLSHIYQVFINQNRENAGLEAWSE